MPAPLLSVRDLSKSYGAYRVLHNLSFDTFAGEVLAIVGANGAGKTTTFRLIAGLARSSGGSMMLDGVDISDHTARRSALGALIEGPGFYPHLTAAQNIQSLSWTAGLRTSPGEIDRLLDIVGLSKVAHRKVRKFSTGMRQRLAIAIAMLGSPKLLILDEPTSGLDALGVLDVRRIIGQLAASGMSILWASHDLREVEDVCSRLIWLHEGELKYCGEVSGLPRGTELLEVTVADAHAAMTVLAEIDGAADLHVVPGGVRIGGVSLGVVIERLTAAELEVSDVRKIRTNFEDVFSATVRGI